MRYYIIAGEASGDLHGSNLIKGLIAEDPEAEFRYWGGDFMTEATKAASEGLPNIYSGSFTALFIFLFILLTI